MGPWEDESASMTVKYPVYRPSDNLELWSTWPLVYRRPSVMLYSALHPLLSLDHFGTSAKPAYAGSPFRQSTQVSNSIRQGYPSLCHSSQLVERNSRRLHQSAQHSINLLNTFYQLILPDKMYNIVIRSVDADHGQQRPELSPEDQMVSSYLEDRSETYRDLVEEQDDVSDFKFTID